MSVPDLFILPFRGGGESPVVHYVEYQGHTYEVYYRWGWITIEIWGQGEVFSAQLGGEFHSFWTEEETSVYLREISQAIRDNSFTNLCLPKIAEAPNHPLYFKRSLP